MAKGYWIVSLEVTDPEQYARYAQVVRPFLAREGARFLVRGGACEVREGSGRTRNVVIEFDSYTAALAAYESDEYQAMIHLRTAAAKGDFVIADGLEEA